MTFQKFNWMKIHLHPVKVRFCVCKRKISKGPFWGIWYSCCVLASEGIFPPENVQNRDNLAILFISCLVFALELDYLETVGNSGDGEYMVYLLNRFIGKYVCLSQF